MGAIGPEKAAHVLAAVTEGETVLITERGIARWKIEPVDPAIDPVARLRAEGRIIQTTQEPEPWPQDKHPRYTPDKVDALYGDLSKDS